MAVARPSSSTWRAEMASDQVVNWPTMPTIKVAVVADPGDQVFRYTASVASGGCRFYPRIGYRRGLRVAAPCGLLVTVPSPVTG